MLFLKSVALIASWTAARAQSCRNWKIENAGVPEAAYFNGENFLIGNVFSTNINTISSDGQTQSLIATGAATAGTVGLYYRDNKLYSAWNNSTQLFMDPTGTPSAKVLVHDFSADPVTLTEIDLNAKTSNQNLIFVNDVYAAPDGRIFATGSSSKVVYEISNDYQTVTTIENGDAWAGGLYGALEIGPNGVEGMLDQQNQLHVFVGISFQAKVLYKVNTATDPYTITEVPLEGNFHNFDKIYGIDGLRFNADHTVLSAVLTYSDQTLGNAVVSFTSSDGWATAQASKFYDENPNAALGNFYTTLTNGPDNSLWVVSTEFSGQPTSQYFLSEVCFPQPSSAPTAPTAAPPTAAPTAAPTPELGSAAATSVSIFATAAAIFASFFA